MLKLLKISYSQKKQLLNKAVVFGFISSHDI